MLRFDQVLRARIKTCGKSIQRLQADAGLGKGGNVRAFVRGDVKAGINVSTAMALADAMGMQIVLQKKEVS